MYLLEATDDEKTEVFCNCSGKNNDRFFNKIFLVFCYNFILRHSCYLMTYYFSTLF